VARHTAAAPTYPSIPLPFVYTRMALFPFMRSFSWFFSAAFGVSIRIFGPFHYGGIIYVRMVFFGVKSRDCSFSAFWCIFSNSAMYFFFSFFWLWFSSSGIFCPVAMLISVAALYFQISCFMGVKGHAGRGTRWFRVINSLY
jgi:hypothetical protein